MAFHNLLPHNEITERFGVLQQYLRQFWARELSYQAIGAISVCQKLQRRLALILPKRKNGNLYHFQLMKSDCEGFYLFELSGKYGFPSQTPGIHFDV